VVRTLQQAVQSGEYSDYQQYAKLVNERPAATLRDLLALNPAMTPSASTTLNRPKSCSNASIPPPCLSAR
jgi:glutamate synthase domain-containing protein 2